MFWALSPCSTMLKQSLKSITSALCLESFSGVLSNHQVNIWCVESGPLVLNCPNIHQNREVSVRCLEFISRTSIKRQSRCPIFWVGPLATTSKPEMYQGLDSAKNTSLYPGSSKYSLYLYGIRKHFSTFTSFPSWKHCLFFYLLSSKVGRSVLWSKVWSQLKIKDGYIRWVDCNLSSL